MYLGRIVELPGRNRDISSRQNEVNNDIEVKALKYTRSYKKCITICSPK
jgi:hypothetical protein